MYITNIPILEHGCSLTISTLRRLHGMSQEMLAEKAGISRALLSAIEAPGMAKSFSMEVFFNLADALMIDPTDLLSASNFPDQLKLNPK